MLLGHISLSLEGWHGLAALVASVDSLSLGEDWLAMPVVFLLLFLVFNCIIDYFERLSSRLLVLVGYLDLSHSIPVHYVR